MKIFIGIIVLIFLYWFFILRPGRLDFWKLAGKYPDEAYDLFKSQDCWVVFEEELPTDYYSIVPKEDWTGPFRLYVPKIGNKIVYVFGKYPDFEKEQEIFIAKVAKK